MPSSKFKRRVCVCGCGEAFIPLHANHFWRNDGCYYSHFEREHPGQSHLLGMRPLGLFGDKVAITAFIKKHAKVVRP